MTKSGLLILAQVDHLSGEDLGWALESLNCPGIHNKSLIPLMTKKGRPGYLLLLDIDPECEEKVASLLSGTFMTLGYHRLATTHVCFPTRTEAINIIIKKGEKKIEVPMKIKSRALGPAGQFLYENDDLLDLHRRIKTKLDVFISPLELRRLIEVAGQTEKGQYLTIQLP